MEYRKEYRKAYWRAFRRRAEPENHLLAIVSVIFELVVGAAFFFVTKGTVAMNEQVVSFVAFTLAPVGLVTLVYLVWHLFKTPADVYANLKERHDYELSENKKRCERELTEMKAHADKYTWEGITFNVYEDMREGGDGIGVEVINNKPFTVKSLSAHLITLRSTKDGVSRPDQRLPWILSDNRTATGFDLQRNGKARLLVVDRDGEGIFLYNDKVQRWLPLDKNVRYTMTIRIECKIDNQPIGWKEFILEFLYDGEKVKAREIKPDE
jgi:hypothetical protein